MGTTIIEYIRNILKRVRKKESNLIMASQNLEDFDREGIRELTKPLFAIPPHQFIFNCGSIDKRFYMDLLQLEEAEYNLIRFPQRGVCLPEGRGINQNEVTACAAIDFQMSLYQRRHICRLRTSGKLCAVYGDSQWR